MNLRAFAVISGLCLFLTNGLWAREPSFEDVRDSVRIFEEGFIQVVGRSEEGQSRVRALRAAEIVAKRDLLEIMKGLHLQGPKRLHDGMLQSDSIRTTVEGFLWGAVKTGEVYFPEKGYAEVCVRVNLRGQGGLCENIWPLLLKESRLRGGPGPAYDPGDGPEKKESAFGVDPPSDGLILDVRDFPFRPALVNRVVTDRQELVFDPSTVVPKILVDRGCGGYTTDTKKARAMLEYWGSKNPMTVKCVGVTDQTDVLVSDGDAEAIYRQDRRSTMLAQARLVFLLR